MGYIVKSLRIFPKEWAQLQVDEQEAMKKKEANTASKYTRNQKEFSQTEERGSNLFSQKKLLK